MLTAPENEDFNIISELTPDNRWFKKLQALKTFFLRQFGCQPKFFVRVPGRVNLIGEHVDYCGYPVLPMAVEQSICLAVDFIKQNTLLKLRNIDEHKFSNYDGDLKNIRRELSNSAGPEWYKYYLCGVQGIYETLAANTTPIGMAVALSGNIPVASGLSSSSALVCAAALATAYVHRLPMERDQMATISANCECYIGTQGGGMDQAIAFLAKEGYAHFVEFYPKLHAQPIRLPKTICFVVANSLSQKCKASSSDFNERVVECRLSCKILAKKMHLSNWRTLTRFAQLQGILGYTLTELDALATKYLPKEVYSVSDICADLCLDEAEFVQDFLTDNTRKMSAFKLRQRTHHVLQESMRVLEFRTLCEQINRLEQSQKSAPNSEYLSEDVSQNRLTAMLFELIQQSHRSLRENYECSHPDLDRLVNISDACGVSARLTGAGWGGCIIALCNSIETSKKYIEDLKEKYFRTLPKELREEHEHNDFQDVIFSTLPSKGAEILMLPFNTDTKSQAGR